MCSVIASLKKEKTVKTIREKASFLLYSIPNFDFDIHTFKKYNKS